MSSPATPSEFGVRATSDLSLGTPRFKGADLASLASQQGDVAAWRQAFAQRGLQAPTDVGGPFAVGVTSPDGTVHLAVDRFARRTLCYRVDGERLLFAESADELARRGDDIDAQAIFDYLYFHAIPSPRTIYRDVFRLSPGHALRFRHGEVQVERWWQPGFDERRSESFEDLRGTFMALLAQAVETETGPFDNDAVGCFLSGGTDSSTVAGLLSRRNRGRPHTYSIGFDAAGYDEMAYARLAAKHFDTQHHEYYVTPDDLVQSIPWVAARFDQPFGNSSALPAYCCARRMKEDGRQLALAGDGGDELFGGNSRYAMQSVFNLYARLPSALRRSLIEPIAKLPAAGNMSFFRRARSFIEQSAVPMPDRLQLHNLLLRLGLDDVLTPAFMAQVDVDAPRTQEREVWAQAAGASLVNQMLSYDWRYTLAESDLPKVRGTARLAGLDVGFPLLDDRLAEFSLLLRTDYKLRGFKLRWFFKEALRGFLPPEIISKRKHGFGLPFGPWLAQHDGLRALAFESLRGFADRGVVRSDLIDRLIRDLVPAHPGYYGEMVWILMMLEQWLRARAPGFTLR